MVNYVFYTNEKRQILSYANFNMNYYVGPEVFEGKDVTKVLPLSEKSRNSIREAFTIAREENKVARVSYDLEGKEYVAHITPLKNEASSSYFVIVQEK